MKAYIALIGLALFAQSGWAAEAPNATPSGAPFKKAVFPEACRQLKEVCLKAGFKEGAAKDGIGLVAHCMNPLMLNAKQPANAKKPLPKGVRPALIARCKAATPALAGAK